MWVSKSLYPLTLEKLFCDVFLQKKFRTSVPGHVIYGWSPSDWDRSGISCFTREGMRKFHVMNSRNWRIVDINGKRSWNVRYGVVKIWDFTPENTFQPLTIFWEIPRAGLGIASVHSCSKNRDTIIAASSMDGHVRLYLSFVSIKTLVSLNPFSKGNNWWCKLYGT